MIPSITFVVGIKFLTEQWSMLNLRNVRRMGKNSVSSLITILVRTSMMDSAEGLDFALKFM
jgi:hypothetical protein